MKTKRRKQVGTRVFLLSAGNGQKCGSDKILTHTWFSWAFWCSRQGAQTEKTEDTLASAEKKGLRLSSADTDEFRGWGDCQYDRG